MFFLFFSPNKLKNKGLFALKSNKYWMQRCVKVFMFLSYLPSVLYLLMVTTTACMTVLRMGRIYINFTPKLPILRNHTGSGSRLDCMIMSHLSYKIIFVNLICQNLLRCVFSNSSFVELGVWGGLLIPPFPRMTGEC